MTDELGEILGTWPGRWRHPDLVTMLADGTDLDIGQVARHVLNGLADPFTETDGITALIDRGEFEIVDSLFVGEQSGSLRDVSGRRDDNLAQRLSAARRDARAEMLRERAVLRERAARAGLSIDDLLDIEELAESRLTEARRRLAAERDRVARAEAVLREELLGQLPGENSPLAASVRDCLDAGEFATARWLLQEGMANVDQGGPKTIIRPPLWEWPERSLEEILRWYEPEARWPFPQLARFVPPDGDMTAVEVVDALRHLAAHRDVSTVGAFAAALGRALGEDLRSPVEERNGGFLTRLVGLDDARLPRLSLLSRTGVPLWVADPGTPPPADEDRPIIWFIPEVVAEPARPGDTAVLDVSSVLRLLARPAVGAPVSAPTRRINLLRHLVPQLGLRAVTDEATGIRLNAGTEPREALAWLLDLCGVGTDAVVLDTVEYETGRHPLAVWIILDRLLTNLREQGGHHLRAADLATIRTTALRETLRERLLEPLSREAAALLALACALDPDTRFGVAELLTDAPLVGLPDELDPAALLDPVVAADELVTAGFLEGHEDGTYGIVRTGIWETFQDGGWDPAEHAVGALHELHRRQEDAHAMARGRHAERVIDQVGHRAENIAAGVVTELEQLRGRVPDDLRPELDRIAERIRELRGDHYRQAYAEVTRPAEPCDLGKLVKDLARNIEWNSDGITVQCVGADSGAMWVHAVKVLLDIALENLLTNAVQAIRTDPSGNGKIMVRLTAVFDRCVLDIEDSGPGLTEQQRTILAGGGSFSTKGGRGSGLRSSRELIRDFGGGLEILPRSDLLGGAHLRVWLPLCAAP